VALSIISLGVLGVLDHDDISLGVLGVLDHGDISLGVLGVLDHGDESDYSWRPKGTQWVEAR
jgi:hypothetical protein